MWRCPPTTWAKRGLLFVTVNPPSTAAGNFCRVSNSVGSESQLAVGFNFLQSFARAKRNERCVWERLAKSPANRIPLSCMPSFLHDSR
jgi:hypothetical protein